MVAWREGINIARQLARDVGMIPPLHGDDGDDNENEEEEEDDHGFTRPFNGTLNPFRDDFATDDDNLIMMRLLMMSLLMITLLMIIPLIGTVRATLVMFILQRTVVPRFDVL